MSVRNELRSALMQHESLALRIFLRVRVTLLRNGEIAVEELESKCCLVRGALLRGMRQISAITNDVTARTYIQQPRTSFNT